jgi:ABC-type antimicrobial peptide transport system permease subunit
VLDAWQITSELQMDPVALGLRGGLQLGFLVALGLSAVGVMVYSVRTARQRSLEFGVLRALGSSPRQMLRQLVVEQIILVVLALLAGSLLGLGLAHTMEPYLVLAVPSWGGDAGTMTRIVWDWAAAGKMVLLWIAWLALALVGMLLLLARERLGRVSRLGE